MRRRPRSWPGAWKGHVVTGSDRERSQFTDRLEELGIPVSIPQKGEQVEGAELVIYSAAIKPDNPERAYAREHGIPEMERSVALGQISARYPWPWAATARWLRKR